MQATILKKRGRFSVDVQFASSEGDTPKVEVAHWPATSKLPGVVWKDLPCLLSYAGDNSKRKTKWTVEALSLGDVPTWVGVNQNRANRIVQHMLLSGALSDFIPEGESVRPERAWGDARFDFQVGEKTFIEVKTPLHFLALPKEEGDTAVQLPANPIKHQTLPANEEELPPVQSRLIKHYNELERSIGDGYRVILLACFLYPAVDFVFGRISDEAVPDDLLRTVQAVISAEKKARAAGLEMLQLTTQFDKDGVSFARCFNALYEE